jgi:hypothetical protein
MGKNRAVRISRFPEFISYYKNLPIGILIGSTLLSVSWRVAIIRRRIGREKKLIKQISAYKSQIKP